MCYIGILIPFFGEFCGVESWELGWWPSGKKTLVMTMSPVERVCVSQSTMTGLCGGWGLGEERLVAADRMFSSFSIRSILSRFPLARISSTICIDSARLTGPLPVVVTLGEAADLGVPMPAEGERLVSGEAGLGSDRLELKLSRLGYSPGSQS